MGHRLDRDILEEWKWMGTPVWSHDGIVCTGETYKKVVKMTFAKGASLKDPSGRKAAPAKRALSKTSAPAKRKSSRTKSTPKSKGR